MKASSIECISVIVIHCRSLCQTQTVIRYGCQLCQHPITWYSQILRGLHIAYFSMSGDVLRLTYVKMYEDLRIFISAKW